MRVLPTGSVGAADIVRSSGYAVLDEAALTTIKRWRFRPAQQSGQTVDATLDVPIYFRLHDQG
ncbi:MAG: energy transducer TonB [Synechococcaceae cyanobacterium SM1_2_3]|nr:energy transducer TonB [Synechococcaceae cyanobacterium SM1_2_3]